MDSELTQMECTINNKECKKMIFIFNALENGWTIKKYKDSYIFIKKHGGKKEILDDKYLTTFVEENCDLKKFFKFIASE